MAHQVEKMFSVRKKPWHYDMTGPEGEGRSTLLQEDVKEWAQARILSGLDWDPVEDAVYRKKLVMGDDGPEEVFEAVPGFKMLVRSDTGEVLTTARESFEMITNTDMGLIIETLTQGHDTFYETGGCLDGGRKVWVLLRTGDLLEVPGDTSPHARYMAILNDHGGHGSCKVIATNIRIVCANTWHMADVDSSSSLACYSFHHRANWRTHVDRLQAEVQEALTGARSELDAYAKLAEEMMLKTVSLEQELRFVDEFVFPTRDEHKLKPRALENVRTARNQVFSILESETCESIRGTAYGLMQAGGEYLDHDRQYKNAETLMGRTVFSAERMKQRARNIAELAAQGAL